ncbi:MAG: DUF1707 domain-containing protein [Gemmatimonadota bacterium]|nr:DUF1707 domain-containing protein [Gemmatimonadota bacterium]MDH3423065.1 DUF1707 domain-containing protein [Gemmatimonadota bacterium]
MTTDGGVPTDQIKQVTIDALCEHFANDAITVEDFEARVDIAHRATSVAELRKLLLDLPSGDLPVVAGEHPKPVPGGQYQVAPSEHAKQTGYAIAVLGGSRRKGPWSPARVNYTVAIMGGVELDFREAALPPGLTEVKVFSAMGGVEVIVPPGLSVESHGIGILGGFEHAGDGAHPQPGAPVLRITGVALMGGVEIKVRHPGETASDARRRRRQERREKRKRLRGG